MSNELPGPDDHERLVARLRDFAIYIAIGLALVFGIIVQVNRGVTRTPVGVPWAIWAGGSALAFGLPISLYRRHWKSPVFWGWLLPLFVAHVFVWYALIGREFQDQESFSAPIFTYIMVIESIAISSVLQYVSGPFWKRPKHARRRNAHRDT